MRAIKRPDLYDVKSLNFLPQNGDSYSGVNAYYVDTIWRKSQPYKGLINFY